MTDRPNVVVVVLDTARADAFEPYGADAGATPTVADIAVRGRAHDNVFATSNWTLPSHASMFTGLLPRRLGLGQAPGGRADMCKPYVEAHRDRLLPEVLRRAGYRTHGVSANLWITSWSGFATGFDTFQELTSGRNAKVQDPSLRTRAAWMVEALRARVDDGASAAAAVIDGWLADAGTDPFFWFVNLVECHSPYLPPRPWTRCGPWERLRTAREAREHLTLLGMWGASAGAYAVAPDAFERMRKQYAASVRQLDDWLDRLLDRLDRAGRLDDTIVVITSDHGENIGESGRLGHAFWLDDRLVRVPLVTMGPAELPSREVTSLASLPRMLAEAIGLADHPWVEPPPDGVAVAQSDALLDVTDKRMSDARATYGFDDYAVWRMTTPSTCATDGTLKLVREGDEDWLYDLSSDPGEQAPVLLDGRVTAAYGDAVRALRSAVDATHGDFAVQSIPRPVEPATAVPADLEDQMRLLGYL
jgi:arylsulfatase A-like enzyme